jgi:hypothetical protein
MDRKRSTASLYVPTVIASGEPRHILKHRDGPTLCGTAVAFGEEHEPATWTQRELCPRCVQQHAKLYLTWQPTAW